MLLDVARQARGSGAPFENCSFSPGEAELLEVITLRV